MVYFDKDKEILDKVWYAIGHVGYSVSQSYGYCAVTRLKEKDAKQNYQVKQWLHKAGDCVAALKKVPGVKYVQGHYGYIRFYYDDTSIIIAVERELQAKLEKDKAEINAVNIDIHKPTTKVLEKIIGYFKKGSKVNVGAIKDAGKLLTYYYAAHIIGWKDLSYAIDQVWGFSSYKDADDNSFDKIKEAIERRVQTDPSLKVNRDKAEDRLLDFSKKLWMEVKGSELAFDFGVVPATYDECWKDRQNGCAWTVAYLLKVGEKECRFSDVTNEGGGSYGYQIHPNGYLLNKHELEDRVLAAVGLA